MVNFNEVDKKIIEAYVNEDVFKSCCEDYINHKEAAEKDDGRFLDLTKYTTTSGVDGVTTGIVCEVDFDKEKNDLYLYIFVEGSFRWTYVDEPTRTALLEIEQEIRQESKSEECFDFMIFNPYVLKIVKSVVGLFKALPPVGKKALDVYYKLTAV